MKIKTIIFDLDGTVADTLPLCIAAFRKSIEPLLKAEITDKQIIETFGPSEEGTIRALIPDFEQEGVAAYLKNYEELHYTCPVPFPGIIDLLDFIQSKGVNLAMVTGKGIHSAKMSIQKFGLESYFEVLSAGSPVGSNKTEGIGKVMTHFGSTISDSIYIGDAPSDITYCKQLGIPIVAAAWASTTDASELKALNPEWLFYTIEDFKAWLAEQL
jgi:phosphoglycolate phosphatase-like HAD superfamily hydrolase